MWKERVVLARNSRSRDRAIAANEGEGHYSLKDVLQVDVLL